MPLVPVGSVDSDSFEPSGRFVSVIVADSMCVSAASASVIDGFGAMFTAGESSVNVTVLSGFGESRRTTGGVFSGTTCTVAVAVLDGSVPSLTTTVIVRSVADGGAAVLL